MKKTTAVFSALLIAVTTLFVSNALGLPTSATSATVVLKKQGTFIDGAESSVEWNWSSPFQPVAKVVIELKSDDFGIGYDIATSLDSSGVVAWTPRVRIEKSECYHIRATWRDSAGNILAQAETASFKILLPGHERTLTLITPTEGQAFSAGETIPVIWTTTNFPEGAHIFISLSDADGNIELVLNTVENTGIGSLTVPDDLPPGTYLVYVAYGNEYNAWGTFDRLRIIIE